MKFNPDNPFFRFINTLTAFIGLNVMFLITCLPIVTIGAAITALYGTTLKYVENDSTYLFRTYWKTLKTNFLRSTAGFLIFAVAGFVIGYNLIFWHSMKSGISYVFFPLFIIVAIVIVLMFMYFFPLQARFQTSFKQTWKNSLLLPIASFKETLIIILITIAAVTLAVFSTAFRVLFIIFGIAFVAYCESFFYARAFKKFQNN